MKRLLACFLCAFALQATAAAHVLDEYLQVAQIALAPGGARVELRLIPGVQVADRVFSMIDVDDDGQISSAEEQAYARRVLQDIALEVDGRSAPLALKGVQFPSRRAMNEGIGAIRLDLAAGATLGAVGEHQLSFRNDHLPELGVYLVNALVPSTSEIKISGQARDPLQREMLLSFHVTPKDTHEPRPWTGVLMLCLCLVLLFSQSKHLRQYLRRPNDEQTQAKKPFS
jgi:nickel/cobalt transporter (NicO) family protein